MALIFHLAENGDNEQITENVANMIITFIDYLMACFKYLYEDDYHELDRLAIDLLKYKDKITDKFKDGFTINNLKQSNSKWKRYSKELPYIMDYLKEQNILKIAGKNSKSYDVFTWY